MPGILSEDQPAADCAVPRGCGYRTAGALYVELGLGEGGAAISEFLIDPPVDMAALGICPLGMRLVRDEAGVWHLFDWVGSESYPNVADFVVEVERFGLSRKIAPTLPLERLGPASRIVLLHARAMIDNGAEYHRPADGSEFGGCACGRLDHRAGAGLEAVACCAGVWRDDVEHGVPAPTPDNARRVERLMPWGAYPARRRPDAVEPVYRPAIFARFPIGRFAVVRDPAGRHEETLSAVESAGHTAALVER